MSPSGPLRPLGPMTLLRLISPSDPLIPSVPMMIESAGCNQSFGSNDIIISIGSIWPVEMGFTLMSPSDSMNPLVSMSHSNPISNEPGQSVPMNTISPMGPFSNTAHRPNESVGSYESDGSNEAVDSNEFNDLVGSNQAVGSNK